jgi:hypothetical protein
MGLTMGRAELAFLSPDVLQDKSSWTFCGLAGAKTKASWPFLGLAGAVPTYCLSTTPGASPSRSARSVN